MAESGQERTEQATPKRLEEARKRGQVPRSTELSTAAVTIAAAAAIYTLGRGSAGQLADLLHDALSISPERAMDTNMLCPALRDNAARALWIVGPILGATSLPALLAPVAIGAGNFSGEALIPQFAPLNPASGLGRVFSTRGLV